ncbi:unnamed protein product [Brachionus calyciflorus]|uniref:Phospholipid scramblase n=1 Tax=Brachionus calyciflorus TaxID=104777 RepID=A0A814BRN3_9BILA|nr:unnamed protein product [Brachionus calyciflorus]
MSTNLNPVNKPPGLQADWMIRPSLIPGCPPGLEYLTQLDRIKVEQLVSLTEVFTGWDTNNKYVLRNANNQQFLYVFEESKGCMRICCGSQRSFKFHVVDNMNQEVMQISRDFKCCAGCCWCAGCCDGCAYEVKVEAPPGNIIGSIRQKGSLWKDNLDILDENGNTILKIEGPCCIWDGACFPCDNEFRLLTSDGISQIGKLTKEYAGFIKELVSLADQFTISFPMDLSVKAKGTLIGALLLIDFMNFEDHEDDSSSS